MCERRKLRVNESKSEVMKCMGNIDGRRLNGELLEEVECLKYLVSHVVYGGIDVEVRFRVNKVGKLWVGISQMYFMYFAIVEDSKVEDLFTRLVSERR